MLRIECLPRLAPASYVLHPKLIAIGLGLAMAACSANVTRFDSPMFGLTESGNRLSSGPIPRESVYGSSASSLADSTPYAGGQYAPSRGADRQYAPRNYASHTPSYESRADVYRSKLTQSDAYSPSSYQPSYPQRATRPSYERTRTYTSPAETAQNTYQQAREPQKVAALHAPDTDWRKSPVSERSTAAIEESPRSEPRRSAATGNSRLIEVEPGDSIYSIAQRHRVSISELMSTNGLSSPSVRPGQKLLLPPAPSAIAASVRQGPVAKAQPKRVAALSDPTSEVTTQSEPPSRAPAGNLHTDNAVSEAANSTAPIEEAGDTYTIKNGESLYGIAVRHRIPLAELLRLNDITDVHKVRAGTVLKLPSSTRPATAIAAAPGAKSEDAPRVQTAELVSTKPVQPVIINAPTRVAALDTSATASDATVQPAALTTDPAPAANEPTPAVDTTKASSDEFKADAIGKFRWPVRGKVITGFGPQPDGSHSDGIKMAVPAGTEVHAAESGVVAYAGNELKGYGNLVLVRHDNGWITAYAHNDELNVKRGDRVRRGQVIAKAGNSGNVDRPQLHFEVRQGSSPVDPLPHLEKL